MNDSHYSVFDDDTALVKQKRFQREEPRTEVKDECAIDGMRHEAIIPYGSAYTNLPQTAKCDVKSFPFTLDTFQQFSISAIERDESVLVSAHTSCGKTVVAEYAIAQSLRDKQRVIYTSPIKALSNQKYRELQAVFEDVGLMTGDVTINPTASCLVMTTEILRNMLYRGSEVVREVHWIIFDEIHYMRDRERGVVWEETIILLPDHARMVFLSATIPNAREFAEWICFLSRRPVHVVYTEKRVIPLVHYFYTDELYLVKDTKFHSQKIASSMRHTVKRKEVPDTLNEMSQTIDLPAVVFSFSRKDCEAYAMKIQTDFLNPEEKKTVRVIFNNAIASLREEDRSLPIIESMLPLLLRGVGIHHSGLLPIIREIVEILFQESLIKILFATETFSIGLNMPAKTAIFTSLRKFDGTARRLLTSGEYIQMSGRAGRRGLDKIGVVISILTEALSIEQIKSMFSASTDALLSAFRLTYNMLLNLVRAEGLDPLYLLSRSFFHFQMYKKALLKEEQLAAQLEDGTVREKDPDVEGAAALLELRENLLMKRCNELVRHHFNDIKMKGRVVDILIPRLGAPLLVKNAIVRSVTGDNSGNFERLSVNVFIFTNRDIELRTYPLSYISAVYDIRCKPDIKVFSKRFKKMARAKSGSADAYDEEVRKIEEKIRALFPEMDLGLCLFCRAPSRKCLIECEYTEQNTFLGAVLGKLKENARTDELNKELAELERLKSIYHMEECKKMLEVLKKLEYMDDHSILLKGKMAAEISTGDELVLTEMIFNSSFPLLPLRDMVALLSCTVCEEKNDDGFVFSEENAKTFEILRGAVQKVCSVMNGCGLEMTEAAYFDRFSYEMMDVVKMWMSGYTFNEICEGTEIFEGTIIRVFKRLEELLRQLSDAALVIGNAELANLFSQGIFLIKRDIVFANSLYL